MGETVSALMEKGVILPEKKPFAAEYKTMMHELGKKSLIGLGGVSFASPDYRAKQHLDFGIKSLHSFHGKMEFLYDDLRAWHQKKSTVIILAAAQPRPASLYGAQQSKH